MHKAKVANARKMKEDPKKTSSFPAHSQLFCGDGNFLDPICLKSGGFLGITKGIDLTPSNKICLISYDEFNDRKAPCEKGKILVCLL